VFAFHLARPNDEDDRGEDGHHHSDDSGATN